MKQITQLFGRLELTLNFSDILQISFDIFVNFLKTWVRREKTFTAKIVNDMNLFHFCDVIFFRV